MSTQPMRPTYGIFERLVYGDRIGVRFDVTTDVGLRRENNEDNFYVSPRGHLFVIADGMGGYEGGEVASWFASQRFADLLRLAEEEVEQTWEETCSTSGLGVAEGADPDAVLRAAVWLANANLKRMAAADPLLAKMGATLAALMLRSSKNQELVGIVNVGDSRVYRLSRGVLEQITADHTEVREVEKDGIKRTRRFLTRCVGGSRDTAVPDLFFLNPIQGDRYLLCTDGVWGSLDSDELTMHLSTPEISGMTRAIVDHAMSNGSADNLTALVVELCDPPPVAEPSDDDESERSFIFD